jgi:hypothetical protein
MPLEKNLLTGDTLVPVFQTDLQGKGNQSCKQGLRL